MVHESLKQCFSFLLNRSLGEAMQVLEGYLSVHPHQINSDRLFAIKTDYQLMADYWRRGYKDPQLPDLYNHLLQRMYTLAANIAISNEVRQSSYLYSLHIDAHIVVRDWAPQAIREEMESFVSDMAMADLEPAHVSEYKKNEILYRHYRSMKELFAYLLISEMWTDGFSTAMEEILLSPTIDTNDQQLLVSSITLAVINQFDIAKFRLLVHVYQKAEDESVRQRALVGWVLALNTDVGEAFYPEEIKLVEEVLENESYCQELAELQRQIIYCINAEHDNRTIQKEIMPDLMKRQGFQIMQEDSEEKVENMLDDILHPDKAEKEMEQLEASFQRIVDMQKQGSDIYFGGFSQMKRFPFFNDIVNWFIPFFMDYPPIATAAAKFKNNQFLRGMMKGGPFCNSDRYSFLLAFEQVVNRIPQEILNMMERGEVALYDLNAEDAQRPAYIRRMYLQDLYRFYRIFKHRECFRNVFDSEHGSYLFLANRLFSETQLEPHFNNITAFLIKQNRLNDAQAILENYGEHRRDFQYYMMAGMTGMNPAENYARALELNPDNERIMVGYARALFSESRYEEALDLYGRLLSIQPEKKSYLLNKSVCLTLLERYDEAEKVLFKLNYDSPNDTSVNRVLAWALTCDAKYEQAEKLYRQLLSEEKPDLEDLLNFGYCLWFCGQIDDAVDCFHRYLKESGQSKQFILENEQKLIAEKGITEPEAQMMLYLL